VIAGVKFAHITRGGAYFRVCGPTWTDPSDTTYAKDSAGRWNARGEFGALYLCANVEAAYGNALRFLRKVFGPAAEPEDIQEAYLPVLQRFAVKSTEWVDLTTATTRNNVGLLAGYAQGEGHPECVAVARNAYTAGERGIVTVSAVAGEGEELAIFDRHVTAIAKIDGNRQRFADWYHPTVVPTLGAQPAKTMATPQQKKAAISGAAKGRKRKK
jgi:hypothetical protein